MQVAECVSQPRDLAVVPEGDLGGDEGGHGITVDRLGLKAFLIGPEIAPGVPALFTVGGAARMGLALTSGNFGGVTFFADALGVIR